MENYNANCNKHFVISANDKYKVRFYSDEDSSKFIILTNNNGTLWAKYKILCAYNTATNNLKKAKDMIIIEKSMLDDKLNFESYEDVNKLRNYIIDTVLDHYIGYITEQKDNTLYFFGISKIVRL